jgi:hypothetical protein
VATEAQDESQIGQSAGSPAGDPAGRRPSLSRRLERARVGRLLLGSMRWAVVFAFVASGYFGAAVVNSGLRQASAPAQQQILAASAAQK